MKNKLKTFVQSIEESNDIFNASTKAEKRVAIAKDCIARIELGQFTAQRGRFCNIDADNDGFLADGFHLRKTKTSIKKTLNDNRIRCRVCAKGSMFMSYIGRVNDMGFDKMSSGGTHNLEYHNPPMTKLLEIFSKNQLDLMEYAFEGTGDYLWMSSIFTQRNRKQCKSFYKRYENSNERLIAICENIIKNKGTFKP